MMKRHSLGVLTTSLLCVAVAQAQERQRQNPLDKLKPPMDRLARPAQTQEKRQNQADPARPTQPGQRQAGQVDPVRPDVEQPTGISRTNPRTGRGANEQGNILGSAELAALLAVGNIQEIELGKFAQSKASNEQVKEFARMMVQDHSAYVQKLQQHAGRYQERLNVGGARTQASTQRTTRTEVETEAPRSTQPDKNRDKSNDPASSPRLKSGDKALPRTAIEQLTTPRTTTERSTTTRVRPEVETDAPIAQRDAWDLTWVTIKLEIGQENLRLTKEELGQTSGPEFDRCYVGHEIGAHVQMLAALNIVREHSSSEFRSVVEEGIEATQKHLNHAKELAKSLEGEQKRQ